MGADRDDNFNFYFIIQSENTLPTGLHNTLHAHNIPLSKLWPNAISGSS